jgi:hypothetical protein
VSTSSFAGGSNAISFVCCGHYRDNFGITEAREAPAAGRLRTRLLQVMAKRNGEWQIVVYHNVDLKPDVEAPEPK